MAAVAVVVVRVVVTSATRICMTGAPQRRPVLQPVLQPGGDAVSLGYEPYDPRLWRPDLSHLAAFTLAHAGRASPRVGVVSPVPARSATSRLQIRLQACILTCGFLHSPGGVRPAPT